MIRKKSSSWLKIFGSAVWIILGIVILGLIFSAFYKVYSQKKAIQREVDILKAEKENLEADNKDLSGLLDYFASESYKEREMRLRLNMQREGEKAIIISREPDKSKEVVSGSENREAEKFSNVRKWWNYFFGK